MVENEMDNPDERRRMARQSKFHYYRDNVHKLAGDQRHVLNMTYDLLAQVILQTTKNTKGLHTWLYRLKDERKDTESHSKQKNSPQYTLLNDLIAALEDTVSSILEEQGVTLGEKEQQQQSSLVVEPRHQSLHDSSSDSANSPLFDDTADPSEMHIKQELHDDYDYGIIPEGPAGDAWLNALPTPQSPARVQKRDRREWEARSEMGPKRAGGGEDDETSGMFSKRSRMDEEEPTSSLEPYRNRKTKLLGRARRCATVQNYGESDEDDAFDRAPRDEDDREPGHFGCFKCGELFDTKKAQMQHSFTAHNTVVRIPAVHTLNDAADDADDDSDIVEAADVIERRRLQQLQAARAASVAPRSAIAAPRVPVVRFSRAATVGPAADKQAWTKNGSGDFQCAYCPRSFPSKRGIDSHGKVHQGVQCAVCHKFMKKEKLANHMVEKHKGTGKEAAHVSTPDIAAAAAARKAQPTTPAARNARAGTAQPVTPATPAARKARAAQPSAGFTCDVCERVFDTEKGMRIHMTGAHTGDPRAEASSHRKDYFACPVEGCKVERNVMGLIYDHLRKDHDMMPFDCAQCGEKFAMKSHLVSHRKKEHK